MYNTSQLVNINVLMITSNLQFAPVPIPVAFHEIRLKCSTKAAITMRCVFNPSLLPTFVPPTVPVLEDKNSTQGEDFVCTLSVCLSVGLFFCLSVCLSVSPLPRSDC